MREVTMDKKKNKIIISPYTQDAFHGVKLRQKWRESMRYCTVRRL